jgi:hypothetical protein
MEAILIRIGDTCGTGVDEGEGQTVCARAKGMNNNNEE